MNCIEKCPIKEYVVIIRPDLKCLHCAFKAHVATSSIQPCNIRKKGGGRETEREREREKERERERGVKTNWRRKRGQWGEVTHPNFVEI